MNGTETDVQQHMLCGQQKVSEHDSIDLNCKMKCSTADHQWQELQNAQHYTGCLV